MPSPHPLLLLTVLLPLAGADFPAWRGDGSGSAGAAPALIGDWKDARIAWVSEAKSPHPWNFSVVRGKTQWPRTVLGNGGYGLPALANGKVYVMYWRPAGTVTATTGPGKYDRMWATSSIPALSLIDADACLVCIDAATGRTLWETVWAGTEMNHVELYGGHNNVCVADGRVFAIGGTGLIYAADAATGAKLWQAELGPSAAIWRWYKADCLARRSKEADPPTAIPDGATPPPPPPAEPHHPLGGSLNNCTYNVCPTVVDGVVITGDWARGGAFVAFDATTGTQVWRRPGGGISTPLPWRPAAAVVLPGARSIEVVAARTGKSLFSITDGAGPTNCALAGDFLVGPGCVPKGTPSRPGWSAWRLSPGGAQRLWALDAKYLPPGYLAAIIHSGRAWLPFTRQAGNADSEAPRGTMGLACVDLETGAVLGETGGLPFNNVCPGPLAMGDLFFYQYDLGLVMASLDPAKPAYLGQTLQHSNYCSSATAGDGFVYFRTGERLVTCLDVRRPADRAPATRHDDARSARYEVTLPKLRSDGKDVRLVLRGRDGAFPQAWILTAGCGYPDVIDASGLRLDGNRLRGSGRAIIEGFVYDLGLDLGVKADGSVEGTFNDSFAGIAVAGDATGGIVAQPVANADLAIYLPRRFCNGQNKGQEPLLTIAVADGKVTTVTMRPWMSGSTSFTATVAGHDLAWKDRRLTGGIDFDIASKSEIIGGRYCLVFDAAVRHNLVWGSFTAQRAGAALTRHAICTYPPFSTALPPAGTPATLADAVLTVVLPQAVVSTMGRYDLTLSLTRDADGVCGVATTSTVGLHPIDTANLVITNEAVTGTITVPISADGYALRNDTRNRYTLDLKRDGTALRGTFTGLADFREPRQGKAAGTWVNED